MADPQKPQQAPSTGSGQAQDIKGLSVSYWPHVKEDVTIAKVMYAVVLALLPACVVGIYYFAWDGLQVLVTCSLGAVACEALLQKIMKKKVTIQDGSAAVTGLLLGMNMPPGSPLWLSVAGAIISIGLGKQVYGGVGYNPFNPALVGRVALLIGFPVQMTMWQMPHPLGSGADVITGATPLGELQTARLAGKGAADIAGMDFWQAFIGNQPGSVGETSELALLIGGAYLLYKHYVTWHIPVSMIGSVMAFSGIFWVIDPVKYASPLFHLLTGGLVLGAIYMATDMVTCPTTPKGQLIFGLGCGILTVIIRMWGGYPEGVSFAIVLMNGVNPLIERYWQPVRYGAPKAGHKADEGRR